MNNQWRYETKIVLKDLSLAAVLNDIYLNPLGFRPLYATRTVNNLYFDSLQMHHFYDHVNGYPQRTKIRLRWYGDFGNSKQASLEIKRKDGSVGTKDIYPCASPVDLNRNISLQALLKTTDAPSNIKELLANLQPSLYNRYERSYFISGNSKVRLTLDSKIRHKSIHSLYWSSEPDDLRIIEFKYDRDDLAAGAQALKNFAHVQDKSSKYIRGLLRIT